MNFQAPLLHGKLIKRYKRFLADILLDTGYIVTAHCPNPGSMLGLLREGAEVWLSESRKPKRKLKYTWELVKTPGSWVGAHPAFANKIAEEAMRNNHIPALANCRKIQREVKYGEASRADFLLEMQDRRRAFVEVKSVSLVEKGCAKFPDAVTKRGRKHLEELMNVVKNGDRGVMLFVIQREDATAFEPAREIDRDYAETLAKAIAAGVEIFAYDCSVRPEGITLRNALPVHSVCHL